MVLVDGEFVGMGEVGLVVVELVVLKVVVAADTESEVPSVTEFGDEWDTPLSLPENSVAV